ncbi:SAF domain-containing protein [Dactylosporangium sp. CA-092794]|uniref:SAF domain-containing protein n=1 Tax=Dactylosporangium sp. CA-092794 TaxID=3239929 RepID=UPI003D8E4CD4
MIRRRVSVPRVLLGAVLVLGFALAGAVVANRVDTRVPVLAAAHDIAAGQTISDADLTVVRVAAEAGVTTVPEAQRATVVGRTAAMPVAAGSLLQPALLGDVAWPPAGQAVIAVGVKPGHAPAGLAAGSHVTVLIVPTSNAPGTAPSSGPSSVVQADATVVSVEQATDQSGTLVVSLLLSGSAATRIASTAGEPSLVQLGAGR